MAGSVGEYLPPRTLIGAFCRRPCARDAARVLRDIDAGRSRAWIPAIVPIELSLLRERARCTIGVPELEATMARNPEIQLPPLDLAQAREFALLAGVREYRLAHAAGDGGACCRSSITTERDTRRGS